MTRESISDAFGWAFALGWSRVTNAATTVREATGPERLGLINVAAALVLFPVLAVLADAHAWLVILGTLWFAIQLLADLTQIGTQVADRAKTLRLLEAKPTGAPRLARVRCSNGTTHEFAYGQDGWRETKGERELTPVAD